MTSPFDAAVRLRRYELEAVTTEIAAMEDALRRNEREQRRIADRLEVELRIASELPHLDTAAFAAAQRQRLGALEHEQREIEANIAELRAALLTAFQALKPLEAAADGYAERGALAAAKAETARLDDLAQKPRPAN